MNNLQHSDSLLSLQPKSELIGHSQGIEDIAFNPKDRDILVSVGNDKTIFAWDLRHANYKAYSV